MTNIFGERRGRDTCLCFCLILKKKKRSFLEYLLYVSPWLINAYAVMVLSYAVIRGKMKKKYIKDFFHLVDDNKTCGTCTLLNNFTHAHTHTQTLRHTQMRCMLSKLLFHSLSDMQCEPDVGGGGYPPDFSKYRLQCGFVKRKCKTLCHSNIKMKQKKATYPPLSSVQAFVFSLLKSNF